MHVAANFPSLEIKSDKDLGVLLDTLNYELLAADARRVRALDDLQAQLSGCAQ